MMKKHFVKRILALTLSLGMFFSAMTACFADTQESSSSSSPNSSTSSSGLTPPEETVEDVSIPRVYDGAISTAQELTDKFAKSGTYKLTANIALDHYATVPAGVEVVLDMNGCTITRPAGCALYILGSLTIIGEGTIKNTQNFDSTTQSGLIITSAGGRLLIDTDDFTAESTFGCIYAIETEEVTINGGTYVNKGPYYTVYCGGYGTVNINGGSFNDSSSANGYTFCGYGWANTENKKVVINVNGGEFYPAAKLKNDTLVKVLGADYVTFNFNGGYFNLYDNSFNSTGEMFETWGNLNGGFEYDLDTKLYRLSMDKRDLGYALAEAKDGDVVGVGEGEFVLTAGMANAEITLMGAGDKTVVDFSQAVEMQSAKLTFKHLKIQGATQAITGEFGIRSTSNCEIVFEDCTIDGAFTHEFSGKVTYIDCTFTGAHYVTTGMATDVTFENCVFDKADSRALYIYATNETPISVTVKKCAFNADAKGYDNDSWTSAIIVDTTNVTTEGSVVAIENCVYSGYYNGLVSDRTTGGISPTIRLDGALGE